MQPKMYSNKREPNLSVMWHFVHYVRIVSPNYLMQTVTIQLVSVVVLTVFDCVLSVIHNRVFTKIIVIDLEISF
jgi:hypothetical protein